MFQRILVPLDDTMRAAAAVRMATAIAWESGAQLVLVRSEPSYTPAQRVIGDRAALQRQVNALRQQGIQAEYAVEIGSREEGILAAARERQADLILFLPAHCQHLELLWYARSAARMLSELPAPLFIWPECLVSAELLASNEASVMVPLDGAIEAERSLPFAAELAEHYHRPLVLVQAIPAFTDGNCRDALHGPGCFSDRVQVATAYLNAVRTRMEYMTAVPIRTTVIAGEPGTQLLRAATTYRAGIIVLSAHSHAVRERYFMGCVATQLLREAKVPILVVPPHVETIRPMIQRDETSSAGALLAGMTT